MQSRTEISFINLVFQTLIYETITEPINMFNLQPALLVEFDKILSAIQLECIC